MQSKVDINSDLWAFNYIIKSSENLTAKYDMNLFYNLKAQLKFKINMNIYQDSLYSESG